LRHDDVIPDSQVAVFRSRGRLPHWFTNHSTYFITFRLRDSLPRDVVMTLIEERDRLCARARNASERVAIEKSFAKRFDARLDEGLGACLLRDHAQVMVEVLTHFDGVRFTLHAWCVMPNHVHVLVYVERGQDLPKIVQGWKNVSAHRIGCGPIWQREYYDRIVRGEREFEEVLRYIRENPSKAGLKDWPWVG